MENPEKSRRGRFLGGVAIISASTFLCKAIGLLFKLPLLRLVGLGGMAYFTAAYHVYLLFYSVAAAGLPVALSVLISENRARNRFRGERRVFAVSLFAFLLLGAVGTGVLFFGARTFSGLLRGMEDAAPAIRAVAPSLFFVCAAGAFRGYFQGQEEMLPSAVSQLFESVGKLVFGLAFASGAVRRGWDAPRVAASAIGGITAGVLLGDLYLIVRFLLSRRRERKREAAGSADPACAGVGKILARLAAIALPITLGASVTSLTSLADTALIPGRLIAGGLSPEDARLAYSGYSSLAVPLYNLPPALIAPLGISLVPALTSALAAHDVPRARALCGASLRICLCAALPAAVGLSVFAEPILRFVFPGEAGAAAEAAPLLAVLAVSVVGTCLSTVTNAMLQASGRQNLPIFSMTAGAAVKIAAGTVLAGSPLGILGAPVSTVLCTMTAASLNLFFLGRTLPERPDLSPVWRGIAASGGSAVLSVCLYAALMRTACPARLTLFCTVLAAALSYGLLALRFGAVTPQDAARLSRSTFHQKRGRIHDKRRI